jgi:hypothetical protein
MKREIVNKSYTIRGADGNDVTVSETIERLEVVLSIQQNDENGRTATVRLDKDQWEALCRMQYSVEINRDQVVVEELVQLEGEV